MEVSSQLRAPAALLPGKEPLVLGGPQSWSGHGLKQCGSVNHFTYTNNANC